MPAPSPAAQWRRRRSSGENVFIDVPVKSVHECGSTSSNVAPSSSRIPLFEISNVSLANDMVSKVYCGSNEPLNVNGGPSAVMRSNSSDVVDLTIIGDPKNMETLLESTSAFDIENNDELYDVHVHEFSGCGSEEVARSIAYLDFGDPTFKCAFCNSVFWFAERSQSYFRARHPRYSLCCGQGKIQLPPMRRPPEILYDLLHGNSESSRHFLDNIRSYNNMFCFTSMGGKIDRSVNTGGCPPVFKLCGQNYHLMGSLLPEEGSAPKFAQLYIYDTDNEISNRLGCMRSGDDDNTLQADIVSRLLAMFNTCNVLVRSFRMARDKLVEGQSSDVRLRLIGRRGRDARRYNLPTVSEIAAIVVGDFDECLGDRDIIVETRTHQLKRINDLNPAYLPLQYPLLFPYGDDGYREDIPLSVSGRSCGAPRKRVSIREWFAYRLHEREEERVSVLYARRLTQQFIVDAFTMVESARLIYIRTHQKQLRCEMYRGLADALLRGETDPLVLGRRVIVPPSFTGGARFMIQNYQDSMAICRWIGYPDLFITFTCNPKWPEIVRFLDGRGLKAEDRPDIVCRVFKMKLDALVGDLRKNKIFGVVKAVVYTVEFQKRGLPHAHILLFLAKEDKYPMPADIDRIISAEIPDEKIDLSYYSAVREFMIHGPCGVSRPNSPCMVDGKCSKHYPKSFVETTSVDDDGYPVYRRRNNGRTMSKNGIDLDNRYVVPHNRHLLLKYGAHLNVEWCNQSRSIKYLFKYVNKGHDRVTASFYKSVVNEDAAKPIDEINMYYDCRYVSPCEAMWRLLGFEIQYKNPPVERLSFHLPDEQPILFSDDDPIDDVMNRPSIGHSMFVAWFDANKRYVEAKNITYAEFPQKFVWKRDRREWTPRKQGFSLGRVFYVPPGSGEVYYLRCLLNVCRGPTSYEEIRTVGETTYDTFRDACYAHGLLDDDKEYIDGIIEASQFSSGHSLRYLFAMLLSSESLIRPEEVWSKCWEYLADDVLYHQRRILNHPDLSLSEEEIKNIALIEIDKILQSLGKSLKDYDSMPYPDLTGIVATHNKLVHDEMRYNRAVLRQEHEVLVGNMNGEQLTVYNMVMEAVCLGNGGVFFVYGYGGTGKTYVWRALSARLRSDGDIVLNVASSGIASLLLPGGRTAHSRFAIPININENSTCAINQGSQLAELIVRAKLIIWDEAPMMHRHCFEALDKTLRDIMQLTCPMNKNKPFGGKTVVFGGDFRQILPVIPKGTRQEIVRATINSSTIWQHCKLLRLTKNMRLDNPSLSALEAIKIESFSKWIASIGDGTIGVDRDGYLEVDIPDGVLMRPSDDPIRDIVYETYMLNESSVDVASYLKDRAILAPTLDVVDSVNEYMISLNSADLKTYLSSDSTCKSSSSDGVLADVHTMEFLNGIRCSGVPNHQLLLKVGTPVMLLRNIDHSLGLCNGTRMVITKLGTHVLQAKILGGSNAGHEVLIPRMSLTPSDPRLPFKFQRRQFPLIVSYAMTINKSQGQSLSHVGLLLKKPVFSHGQLYVAASRVTRPDGLRILVHDKDNPHVRSTINVVYKEVFQNL